MDQNLFIQLVGQELTDLYEMLEAEFPDADFDLLDNILDIKNSQGNYIINRHIPSLQIWLSSPVSGGDYFSYNALNKNWINKYNKTLREILTQDLNVSP